VFGLDIIDRPGKTEPTVGSVGGWFVKEKDAAGEIVQNAGLTINDVAVASSFGGIFILDSGVPGLTAGASSKIDVVATRGADQATISFTCPDDVVLTGPVEGATFKAGQQLSVSWAGRIGYPSFLSPRLRLFEYDSTTNDVYLSGLSSASDVNLTASRSSATLTLPQKHLSNDYDGYVIELVVPGTLSNGKSGDGYCSLHKRVHIKTE
jgi:hypothetical protein